MKRDSLSTRSQRPQGPLTDLERSEFYLREGERLANMGSWSLRPDGIFDYWSPETFAIFGFDPAKGIPTLKEWLDVLHPTDGDRVHALIRKMFSEGVKGDIEYRVNHPEHGQKTMRSTGEPVFENGVVTRLIGNTLDITKQEELTQKLRRREAYLAQAQRLSRTGSFGWDISSGEIYWSDETFRIFELDPKTKITTDLIIERTHPDDRKAVQRVIECASSERTEFALEHRLLMPNGSIKYLRVVGRPSTDEAVRSEFVGAVTDVTERKRAEALLAGEKRLLEMIATGVPLQEILNGLCLIIEEHRQGTHASVLLLNPDGVHLDVIAGPSLPEEWTRQMEKLPIGPCAGSCGTAAYRGSPVIVSDIASDPLWDVPEHRAAALSYGLRASWSNPVLSSRGKVLATFCMYSREVRTPTSQDLELIELATRQARVAIERDISEQALRRSEFYLAEGQRLSHAGSWSFKPDLTCDYWSTELYEILGFDPKDGIPTISDYLARIHPEDRTIVEETIKRMVAAGEGCDIKKRVIRQDGVHRVIRCVGMPVRENGIVTRFVGTLMDITEQEELTEELRRREARLSEAQRLSHTGSCGWNAVTGEWTWSEEQYRILGYERSVRPAQELMADRVHPDDLQMWVECCGRAQEGKQVDFEHRLIMPDGSVKHLHVVGYGVQKDGKCVELIGTARDITERKEAEEELRASEAEVRQILDLTPQHVGVFEPDGTPLYANRAALEYFGITLDQWRRGLAFRLQFVHPDDREHFSGEGQSRFFEDTPCEFEVRLRRHDGEFRHFLVRRNPVKDQRGQITRWYSTATDIEDRKRAEEEIRKENIVLREELGKTSMFEEVIGTSPVLQMVLARAAKVAPTDSTVLIMGETGTGKELIARAIHKRSNRSERPFISVNCAAVPSSLIMSELFGHEKGTFTGAVQRRLGRFELAEGGTIFLDEVGDLPMETQIALLRVLQEREFERVGGMEVLRADVRVISATNRDLQTAIADGAFRNDLYYRLNVFPIKLPPLRERIEDVPLLVNYFVDRYATRAGKKIKHIQKKALQALGEYSWPGNVRELQNVIERSLIIGETNEFSIDKSWFSNEPASASSVAVDKTLIDRKLIEEALAQSNGKVSGANGAAAKLGMPPSTLESRIRSLRINKFQFKGV